MKFRRGSRYGIIGDNGVGKSTLLRRIAKGHFFLITSYHNVIVSIFIGSIPGISPSFKIAFIQQELPCTTNLTVLQFVCGAQNSVASLEIDIQNVEKQIAAAEAELEV